MYSLSLPVSLLLLFLVCVPTVHAQEQEQEGGDVSSLGTIANEEEDDTTTSTQAPVIEKQDVDDKEKQPTKRDEEGMKFAGFQGQLYNIPAQSGEVYNLITFPNFQLNARFVYLPAQECPEGVVRKGNATCPARAGTYIDQLGLSVGHDNILIEAHPSSIHVRIDSKKLNVGTYVQLKGHNHKNNKHTTDEDDEPKTNLDMSYVPDMRNSTIVLDQMNHMTITCPLFSITIINIAHSGYLDMAIALLRGDWIRAGQTPSTAVQPVTYPNIPLHGLLGQTWKNTWNNNDRVYEGDVIDYMIASRDPFGTSFEYNLYRPNL